MLSLLPGAGQGQASVSKSAADIELSASPTLPSHRVPTSQRQLTYRDQTLQRLQPNQTLQTREQSKQMNGPTKNSFSQAQQRNERLQHSTENLQGHLMNGHSQDVTESAQYAVGQMNRLGQLNHINRRSQHVVDNDEEFSEHFKDRFQDNHRMNHGNNYRPGVNAILEFFLLFLSLFCNMNVFMMSHRLVSISFL